MCGCTGRSCASSCICSCHRWGSFGMSAGRPSTKEALAAVGIAKECHAEAVSHSADADPAARVLDAMGREWAQKKNGSWSCLDTAIYLDSVAEIDTVYGPIEVLG